MASIVLDAEVFMQFTEKSKQQYSRIWAHFRNFVTEVDFETGPPGEEDPEMYEAAGIPYQPPSTSSKIQQAVQSAITSLPSLQAANVTVKVLVMQDNHGSVNF